MFYALSHNIKASSCSTLRVKERQAQTYSGPNPATADLTIIISASNPKRVHIAAEAANHLTGCATNSSSIPTSDATATPAKRARHSSESEGGLFLAPIGVALFQPNPTKRRLNLLVEAGANPYPVPVSNQDDGSAHPTSNISSNNKLGDHRYTRRCILPNRK